MVSHVSAYNRGLLSITLRVSLEQKQCTDRCNVDCTSKDVLYLIRSDKICLCQFCGHKYYEKSNALRYTEIKLAGTKIKLTNSI